MSFWSEVTDSSSTSKRTNPKYKSNLTEFCKQEQSIWIYGVSNKETHYSRLSSKSSLQLSPPNLLFYIFLQAYFEESEVGPLPAKVLSF